MKELLELVLEDIPAPAIREVVSELNSANGDGTILDQIRPFTERKEDEVLFFEIETPGLVISNLEEPSIRIIRYSGLYDVDLTWLGPSSSDRLNQLKVDILKLAVKYQIKNVYCGIEPAMDKATRFFTNDKNGPLLKDAGS